MLFILTGGVQSGKTRWLERLLVELAADGVESCGVLAPGVWRPRAGCEGEGADGVLRPLGAGEGAYEKLGIDNVLLPQGERLRFAQRRDLAERDGLLAPASQSAAAQLAWEIPDEAIARVNAHFAVLAGCWDVPGEQPGLLVVDELGRLELEHGCGLTAALDLLDSGATAACPHALAVVRASLLERAKERFAAAWGGCVALTPGDDARAAVRAAFGLASLIDNKYH